MNANDPIDLTALRHVLYSAVVADVLDGLGLRSQVVDVELTHASGHGVDRKSVV